jgi:carbon storage regulator
MLVLSRNKDERIVIGDDVVITVVEVKGKKVKLGIEAPKTVSVHRQEVYNSIHEQK